MTRARDAKTGRFVRVQEPTAITAAAASIASGQIDQLPRSPKGWQTRAWRLWRMLGILHFPTTFKAKQVGRLKWNVEVDGTLLEPEQADKAMEAITEPLGVREASKRLALNLEVAGEVWYARISDEWRVYAATTSKLKEKLASADINVRGWNPDPENPEDPTSAVMAALGTADQVRLMIAMSRSQDRNRMAQRGILLIPKEGQFPEGDPFESTLETAMTAPIADEYAASAVVPPVVSYPGDYIEKWRHLLLDSPYDEHLSDRIEKAIRQFALELDMPPEMLLGNMDSNHWNAWLSDEQNYRAHVEPLGMAVGEIYARAMMQAVDGSVIVVTPDPADMLARIPSFADALEAAKIGAVDLDFLRRILGADEDDKPDEADIDLILRMQGIESSAPPEPVRDAPQMPEALPSPNGNGNGSIPVTAALSDDEKALERLGDDLADIDQHLLLRLAGAADMVASQVRSRVDAEQVGLQDAVASEVERLSIAWGRMVDKGHTALRGFGIDTDTPAWTQAKETSLHLLADGMTVFLLDNIDRPDSEMPEVPTDLLRQVLAAAGGSGTAVVSALVAPRGILPLPTPADPQGFAVGVLSSKALKEQGIAFTQWRFRYGTALRVVPFEFHKEQDGRFADLDGVVGGWYPGDHKGCLCQLSPVYRRISVMNEEG